MRPIPQSGECSVGPATDAPELEIVAIRFADWLAGVRLRQNIGQAIALGVGDRFFFCRKQQADLMVHIP